MCYCRPLNTIVINKGQKCAGTGADPLLTSYLNAKGQRFIKKRRKELHRTARDIVFDFGERWVEVAEAFRAPVLKPAFGPTGTDLPLKLPKIPQGGGEESPEHRNLKEWVRNNPAFVKTYGQFKPGKTEYLLSSGDKLDVHLEPKPSGSQWK